MPNRSIWNFKVNYFDDDADDDDDNYYCYIIVTAVGLVVEVELRYIYQYLGRLLSSIS